MTIRIKTQQDLESGLNKGEVAALPDLGYRIWALVYQTSWVLQALRHQELKIYKISPMQAATLTVINMLGKEATPGEISKRLIRRYHSTLELLQRMEEMGLVNKNHIGNRVAISLTVKGLKLVAKVKEASQFEAISPVLTSEERLQLMNMLVKIRDQAYRLAKVDIPPLPDTELIN